MRVTVLTMLLMAVRAFHPGTALGAGFRYGYSAPAPILGRHGLNSGIITQHHIQDELGQYSFGYASSHSARKEMKTADGVVRGSYSYIDSYGIPQKVNYVADALGFRVAATNLPVGPASVKSSLSFGMRMPATPMTMGMRAAPLVMAAPLAYAPAKTFSYGFSAVNPLVAPRAMLAARPILATRAMAAPMTMAAPMAIAGPMASKQMHVQDAFGQYKYGYANINSAKKEMKTADGVVRGSYSYMDSFGIPQKVNYVADALGFRVAATNLPVGPAALAPLAAGAW